MPGSFLSLDNQKVHGKSPFCRACARDLVTHSPDSPALGGEGIFLWGRGREDDGGLSLLLLFRLRIAAEHLLHGVDRAFVAAGAADAHGADDLAIDEDRHGAALREIMHP